MLGGTHKIELYDSTPIYQKVRRFPDPISKRIDQECHVVEKQGIIEKNKSPMSSPIVPVRKKNGSLRLCMDYRKLNKVIIPDRFPLPNLVDLVYSLHGVKYFTSLDLIRGYYQLPVDENSKECTAFTISHGHWPCNRLSFSSCHISTSNTPSFK